MKMSLETKSRKSLSCLHDIKPNIWESFVSSIPVSNKHVMIFCMKFESSEFQRYLMDIIYALQYSGIKITIVTWKHEVHFKNITNNPLTVISYAGWIPETIFGYFKETLASLRTMYMTSIVSLFPPKPKPKLVFCEGDTSIGYLLKMIGKFTVVQLQNYGELAPVYNEEDVKLSPKDAQNLRFFDEILVPSKIHQDILVGELGAGRTRPTVSTLYPVAETELSLSLGPSGTDYLSTIAANSSVFVMFGEYREESNFELGLEAFDLLIKSLKWSCKSKTFMIIAGNCERNNAVHQLYLRRLTRFVERQGIDRQVKFIPYVTRLNKRLLLRTCLAVVHLAAGERFNRVLLQALHLGKPVLALHGGFADEVLENGVTGYLLQPTAAGLAELMYEFVFNRKYVEFMSTLCLNTYRFRYSHQRFRYKVVNMVYDLLCPEHRKIKISRSAQQKDLECLAIRTRFEDYRMKDLLHQNRFPKLNSHKTVYVELLPKQVSENDIPERSKEAPGSLVIT